MPSAGRPKTNAPRSPWDDINGAGTLYNAMIAPLGPSLAESLWYQGESDTGLPGYERRLAAMMADWRRQFRKRRPCPSRSSSCRPMAPAPPPRRERLGAACATLSDVRPRPTAGPAVVVTLDLGDPYDIHPGEKQEVGRRAADALRVLTYGEPVAAGPRVTTAERAPDGSIVLTFVGAAGGLIARSADTAIGFEFCGADGVCRYAPGLVTGDKVTLKADGGAISRVRYGWADSPVVNLFDQAGRAVGSFEVRVP
jgi:sialate O-acetylesterase